MEYMLLAAMIFSALMLIIMGFRTNAEKRASWRKVVDPSRYAHEDVQTTVTTEEDEFASTHKGWIGRLESEAKRAGMNVNPLQFLVQALIAGILIGGLVYTLIPISSIAIAASLVGFMAPRLYIAKQRQKRSEAFSSALDGALSIMSQSLRAGSSLSQAVARAADQCDEPVATELRRAAKVIKMGTAVEALSVVGKRVDSKEWELLMVATRILEQTGGNLAEVYDQIGATIRQRRLARKSILAQTAQIRMTAGMVGVIPIAITLIIRMMNPTYFDPLLASTMGSLMFAGCFGLIGVGFLWIRSMASVSAD